MSQCDFIIDTNYAITMARKNKNLRIIANDMMRMVKMDTSPNEHLAVGIPQYLAGMMYAVTICGDEVKNILW